MQRIRRIQTTLALARNIQFVLPFIVKADVITTEWKSAPNRIKVTFSRTFADVNALSVLKDKAHLSEEAPYYGQKFLRGC